ncbi:MAG: 1-(5-phosphoribosyl)-5-[(5-phosphoribosylamino)methylideneamino]imidazole-4-carboxamide isomerase [Clostridia bacterium]|nr:1-(5-phosphoribosyl)-5-[(5-phosphoribosylamino)methylideneamino]imidazole-4-carboxamide isomerase [Clostridia bacterium]
MNIFPAIDLLGGCAVRLQKGDYEKVTVYSKDPLEVAKYFESVGARYLHIVDLDGAKDGTTANFETVKRIVDNTSLSVEIGGGVRDMERVDKYLELGVDRVIIGTAAVTDPIFLTEAVKKHGNKIAVGVDIKDGMVAIKGWREVSGVSTDEMFATLQNIGIDSVICTDISKDGMMSGTNIDLYRELSEKYSPKLIASGGVSTMDDIKTLKSMNVFGAIVGKAIYTGAIELSEALSECREEDR